MSYVSNILTTFAKLYSWILIVVSTLVTVLVLKIVHKDYSWNQHRPTETDRIRGNERVRNGENLALCVMGNRSRLSRYFLFYATVHFMHFDITPIMALNQKPLVNSFFEVADKPGVTLTLDQGYAIDILLQVLWLICLNQYLKSKGEDDSANFSLDGRITCACKAVHWNFKERPSLYNLPEHFNLFGIR